MHFARKEIGGQECYHRKGEEWPEDSWSGAAAEVAGQITEAWKSDQEVPTEGEKKVDPSAEECTDQRWKTTPAEEEG